VREGGNDRSNVRGAEPVDEGSAASRAAARRAAVKSLAGRGMEERDHISSTVP